MPNLTEFLTGKAILEQLGGEYELQKKIGFHTSFATERGFGGLGIPGIPETGDLPGLTFRFCGSDRANYCKMLRQNGFTHCEFRYLRAKQDESITGTYPFVTSDRLKEVFSQATGLCLD